MLTGTCLTNRHGMTYACKLHQVLYPVCLTINLAHRKVCKGIYNAVEAVLPQQSCCCSNLYASSTAIASYAVHQKKNFQENHPAVIVNVQGCTLALLPASTEKTPDTRPIQPCRCKPRWDSFQKQSGCAVKMCFNSLIMSVLGKRAVNTFA